MAMSMPAKPWTLEDLQRLPDDGNKYEVVFGELYVTPAPAEEHENILARLSALLTPFVTAHDLGRVYHPRAVVRFDGSEAEPDLFVRSERVGQNSDWDDAPKPSLVVEVLSASTRRRDLGEKRRFYLHAGVAEYWVVDPDERTVRVVRSGVTDRVVHDELTWMPRPDATLDIAVPALFASR